MIGIADEALGSRPAPDVTLRAGAEADAEALRDFVRERIAGFKVPDRVEFRSDFPRTATARSRSSCCATRPVKRASSRARRATPS